MKKVTILCLIFTFCVGLAVVHAAEEIVVGGIMPLTGRGALAGAHFAPGFRDGLLMANEAGGVNGKMIKYVEADGTYTVNVAVAAFKRMMAQHNPIAIYGESTGLSKAIAPEINSRYKVLYTSTSMSSELADPATNPYMFVSGPTYQEQFGIILKYIAKEKPGARVAFCYSDTAFGRDPIPYGRELCKKLGLKVVAEEIAAMGAVDVTSQVLDMKRKKVEYCVLQGYVVTPVDLIIKTANDYGLDCMFMGTWSTTKWLMKKLGPLADRYMGVAGYGFWSMDEVPGIKKIKEWNIKKYGEVKFHSFYYLQSWVAAQIMVECMRVADKAGNLNGDGLAEALQNIKDLDVGGIMPPITIKNNSIPVARMFRGNSKTLDLDPVSDWIYMD